MDLRTILLPYEMLRRSDARPRVHPNGFIQLDLGPQHRLHVWPDAPLPRPKCPVTIHDHVYAFTSRLFVIEGEFIHRTYDVREDSNGDHMLYEVYPWGTHRRTTPYEPVEGRYRVTHAGDRSFAQGETYRFASREFHDTQVRGFAATVLRIEPFDPSARARVACPTDLVPDYGYRRSTASPEELWPHIRRALMR